MEEAVRRIKESLNYDTEENDEIIEDVVQQALNYCNLKVLPTELDYLIRKKVKLIVEYKKEVGIGLYDVVNIKEGDTSITYNENQTKDDILGLSSADKKQLQMFRRIRR